MSKSGGSTPRRSPNSSKRGGTYSKKKSPLRPWFILLAVGIAIAAAMRPQLEQWLDAVRNPAFSGEVLDASALRGNLNAALPAQDDRCDWKRVGKGFTLCYSEQHEQALWVAYELTNDETRGEVKRSEKFRADPNIPTGSASLDDYRNSGYDRGHLAPAADMKWSETAMEESFLLSNISPQDRKFNAGGWAKLEERVRIWARENEAVFVITGPVLRDPQDVRYRIGPNNVSVPKYYFKVVLDATPPSVKAIGLIMPNEPTKRPIYTYAMSVAEVEARTGLDFFPALPDSVERIIESTLRIEDWSW